MTSASAIRHRVLLGFAVVALSASGLRGQSSPELDTLLAPHRLAMRALTSLNGEWRGTGWTLLGSGEKASFTQRIRVGSAGEGALKIIEGRSYGDRGRLGSTNFEIISFNQSTKIYTLRLYTNGNVADVPIAPTANGFKLEYPVEDAMIHFTVAIANGVWSEVAERWTKGKDPVRFLELTLQKVGETDWPGAGTVPPD